MILRTRTYDRTTQIGQQITIFTIRVPYSCSCTNLSSSCAPLSSISLFDLKLLPKVFQMGAKHRSNVANNPQLMFDGKVRACAECKRLKLRCDRHFPCLYFCNLWYLVIKQSTLQVKLVYVEDVMRYVLIVSASSTWWPTQNLIGYSCQNALRMKLLQGISSTFFYTSSVQFCP